MTRKERIQRIVEYKTKARRLGGNAPISRDESYHDKASGKRNKFPHKISRAEVALVGGRFFYSQEITASRFSSLKAYIRVVLLEQKVHYKAIDILFKENNELSDYTIDNR